MVFTLPVNLPMTDFHVKKLPHDCSAHAGLALAGQYLKRINTHAINWFDWAADLNTKVLSRRINGEPIEILTGSNQ